MKQFLVLLLAFSLVTGCKDNKKPTGRDDRNKDDYGDNSGKEDDKGDKDDSRNTDFNGGESWSSADINRFNRECEKSLNGNDEMIEKFCPCVLEKMQKRFSSFADANTAGTEAEGEKMAKDCIADLGLDKLNNNSGPRTGGGSWSSAEINAFVSNCEAEAVRGGSMSRTQASSYCNCMQEKFEEMYPNAADAGSLTAEDLQTPAMQRLIRKCLE
ncbi:MAG: hypothetical protein JNM88_00035 [Chitinophagaceae bacterium]|nr:hypothetical protein [Chitinophagaceae bacterium]